MANEWDVVSEEPARPARVASGPQASAAADPWAVVGEAPARASVPDFSNVRGAVSPTVRVAPREGFFSGLMRIGSEGVRRGGAATVASLLHSGADLVDQTVQSGLRRVMEPLGMGEAFSDPLGARATADENLRIAQEISADRAAAQATIGGRPSLAQAMEHPLDSAGQYARHIVNIGSESVIPMVAAMATRNPAAASAVLGGTVGAQEYTDLRGEGVDRPTALAAAGGAAAVEAAGETFGLPAVLGTGRAGLRGLMRAAGAEGLQEGPVQIVQQNIGDVALGQETPVAQQLADALDAMIIGGAFGAGGHTATNAPSYLSSVFAGEAPPVAPAQANPTPQPDTPRTNAIAPEMLAAGNEALREQAAPPRRRAAAEAGAVIDDRLQALRDAAGRRLPDEERSALAAEAADLEALVREQDALSAAGVMGSPETRLTAAERAQADQRRAEIRAALEADRAAAEYGRQLQTLERQLGNIDTDAGLIDLAERIAGTPVDTGGKPAVQRAPQQSAANATGENRVQDQEDRRQAEGRTQAEGQGQAQEVVAAEGGSGVSATPAAVPASPLEGDGNAAATREADGVLEEQSRLDLIDAWRAATTADERAAAAQRIAEHDARAADRGRAGGEAGAGDGARREAGDAGAIPADVRGNGEQAPASRPVRDAAAGRVADRYQDTDDADIRAALGSAARGITVHRSIADLHPDDRERLGVRESDDDIEGLYDPDTGRVHIFEANLDTASMPAAARRAWVAAHERSGHAGLRGMFADAGKSLTATLRRARQNPTIDAMVRAMEGGERQERGDILVEEAIVELGAALRTGDFGHIRDRYGVDVSPAQRSAVRDFIGRIVSAVREALGKPAASMSDADVWRLIEDANRYAKRGEVRGARRRARGPVASKGRGRPYDSKAFGQKIIPAARRAYQSLSVRAKYAIDGFQMGTMSSGNVIERDADVQNEIEAAFAPVRELLRKTFGDRVVLYRAQESAPKGERTLLSWSFSSEGGRAGAGAFMPRKMHVIGDAEIERIVKQLDERGHVTLPNGERLVRSRGWPEAPGGQYHMIYDRSGNVVTDHVGGGESLREYLRNDDSFAVAENSERAKHKAMYRASVPVDDIFWIYQNALSAEAIVRRDPAVSGDQVIASRSRRTVTATTGAGKFQLTDEVAPAGTDFSEFGEVRQVIARDGDKQIGKLVYANDGTPPTIEVAPEYRRRGVATAMLKLAREQGGVLGDARSGMRRDGGRPGYRTDAGQAFREGADESRVTLADYMEQRGDIAARDEHGVVASRRTPGPDDPLPGAPKVRGATGPDPKLVAVAERYAADNGIDLRRQAEYVKADPERGARIAAAYEAMKHDPQNPRVRRAYASLIEQTRAQYDALDEAGYRFYFTDPAADPYNGNPWDAMRDLRENSRMGVFPTDAGFGSGATDIDVSDNPLMADTGLRWPFGSERGELRPVLANDLFRAVHDAFGHGLEGAGFRADGEENAWQAHVRLFTGDAIGAITTETRGQNSWLNFGPYGESNRTAKVEDTVFADQKTGLMPEWTWTEGRAGDIPVASRRSATLNIGLSTKELRGGGELTEAEVLSAVKASGVKVLKATRQVSDSEPTLVIDIDRRLTKDEGDRISAALDQEAIVQRHDSGDGELFGPMAEKWSPYNPAWFVMHDGGRASDGPIASRRTPFSAKQGAASGLFPNEGATKRTKSSVRRVVDSSGRSVARGNVNSRGKAISPIKQGLDNFWRWFGDSVAVDEKERPLVLFHATTGDFDTFETGRKTKNNYGILGDLEVTRSGIFLTPEISAAEEYVEGKSDASVMQLYAKLEDPLDLSSGGLTYADEDRLMSAGVNTRMVTRAENYWELFDNAEDGSNDFVDALRKAGYDGAIFYEKTNDRNDALTYVVFDPGQVKSVTGNTGTFSSGSKSIIASRRASGFSAKKRQTDAVSADAYHYSTRPGLTELDPSYAGTAGAGRERRRFGMGQFGKQGGTAARLGFYVREPGAEVPGAESVVRDAGGQHLYRAQLSNLYDLRTDPRGYADEAGVNQDYLEELVSDGGFDGFLAGPQPGIDTPTAVVFDIGKKKIPVEAVEDDGVVASRRSGEPFYSAALRAIEAGNGAPRRGTAEQWKGWLDGAVRRGEMKQSERDWLGIDDWIAKQGGAVTREQLADFIRANEVQVDEVVLGGDRGATSMELPDGWDITDNGVYHEPFIERFVVTDQDGEEVAFGASRADAIHNSQDIDERADAIAGGAPKFAAYQLPGGENYRELLLTLPPSPTLPDGYEVRQMPTGRWGVFGPGPTPDTRYGSGDTREDAIRSFIGHGHTGAFKSSHFDQPNILAHVRFNERTDADGKRVLFLEEVQSDWHQEGRKKGYIGTGKDLEVIETSPGRFVVAGPDGTRLEARDGTVAFTGREYAEQAIRDGVFAGAFGMPSGQVPNAPFKATDEWAMLAFKRMVRVAAEGGFDRIAWTTGEQQAERYDLSKQVSQIRVIPGARNTSVPVGMRRVIITKSDGADIDLKVGSDGTVSAGPFNAGFNGKSLDDVVGNEIAERIMAAEKETALRGDGLRVGGSGMRGFYDKILPSAVNKWAKKLGGRVQPPASGQWYGYSNRNVLRGPFETAAQARAEGFGNNLFEKGGGHDWHSLEMTPAMRDAALEGQPLFSRRTPQRAQVERSSLFGRLAASGYAMGNAAQPQPGGRFVSLQRAADGLRVKLQDKMLPALRVQERATAGGASQAGVSTLTLDDMQNAYRMENLRHGATKEGVDKLNDEHVMPIQRALRDAGFSLSMFEDYLYALAAPERNASIAQINRGMPDAGSGIATQQARDILAGRAPGVYSGKVLTPDALRLFKSLEPHVRAIRNIALDSAVEAGQLPAQLARALRQKYPNYVPMRGKDDVLDQARTAAGRGLSQARSGMKRALGRGQDNIPQNVLGELIGDAQMGIAAREQSKATKAFLRFALANPMPELFEVEPVDLEWKFSESTGEAYLGVKGRAEDVDSKMIVMQDGKPVYVKFHDEGLRDAILNMGVEDFAGFTKWAGWLNRWRSAVLTRFNPAFPPVNIMRDILFGGTAVSTELGAAAAARAAGIYPRAMAAAWAHARGRRGDASVPDAQKTIADWVQEFYETGGSTGLTMTDEPADLQRKLEMASMATGELMKMAAKGRPLAASAEAISRAGKPIIDLIESANEASENALRISTYIEQRQRGVSKFKAAEYAKNVTINFNRKGQFGPVLNAIYLFFNASMQGTNAVLRVLRNPKAMAFLAGMGALQAMLAASMMGDDDDDGITQWDTVPDYVKRTSLVIPVGDDRYFALPMPYGFNLITYVGGRATQYAYSGRRRTDSNVALDILKSTTEAFSPVPVQDGYSALFGDQLAFFMRLGANRDDFGGKLTNTDEYSQYPVPLALQGKATTPRIYHSTAQLLAKLGGGDLAEKIPPVGYLDVSPEQLEAVTNYFGGGITSLLNKSMTWGEQMQAGNLRGVSDVVAATPIASRFYGKPSDARAIAQRYYGERGEFARHRAIVNERVATGMSLEEAKADRPKEYVKGLDQGTYKRSGKRKDGSRYRAGEKRPGIQETEGAPTYTAKDVRKRVSAIGELIAGVREGMTNAELAAAYSAQHRIAKQTVGSNFMPEGMTGKPADLGLPSGFAEAAPAPARVKNRAIKLLQDLRAAEEQRLLRALQFQRRLDSVKMPAQQVLDQAKLDRGFEAMFGGDNFDPEATSP